MQSIHDWTSDLVESHGCTELNSAIGGPTIHTHTQTHTHMDSWTPTHTQLNTHTQVQPPTTIYNRQTQTLKKINTCRNVDVTH